MTTDNDAPSTHFASCIACRSSNLRTNLYPGSFALRLTGNKFEYSITECQDCGLGRLAPTPDQDTISQFYGSDYGIYQDVGKEVISGWSRRLKMLAANIGAIARHDEDSNKLTAPLSRVLAELVQVIGAQKIPLTTLVPLALAKSAAILDYGCASGWWLRVLKEAGYSNLWGYDLDQPALADLETRGINIVRNVENLPEQHFDCIRLEHVLEHVTDPSDTLRRLRKLLRPNGTIALVVPNFGSWARKVTGSSWSGLVLPYHLSHFTERSLRLIAEQAGLKVRNHQFLPIWGSAKPAVEMSKSWFTRLAQYTPNYFAKMAYYGWCQSATTGDFLGIELSM